MRKSLTSTIKKYWQSSLYSVLTSVCPPMWHYYPKFLLILGLQFPNFSAKYVISYWANYHHNSFSRGIQCHTTSPISDNTELLQNTSRTVYSTAIVFFLLLCMCVTVVCYFLISLLSHQPISFGDAPPLTWRTWDVQLVLDCNHIVLQ